MGLVILFFNEDVILLTAGFIWTDLYILWFWNIFGLHYNLCNFLLKIIIYFIVIHNHFTKTFHTRNTLSNFFTVIEFSIKGINWLAKS